MIKMVNDMELNNRKVIITGCASGMGKEMTKILLSRGAIVFGLDINKDNLMKLEKEMNNNNLKTYVVDISKKEELKRFHEKYIEENEYVDILINNAGIIQPFIDIKDITDDILDRVMNINFFGPVNLTRLFLSDMIGSNHECYIVNTSSMGGFFPFPGQSIYGASKAGIKLFTEGLYSELRGTKVRVMVVFPGAINTNIMENSNVKQNISAGDSKLKLLSAHDAAKEIIHGIEKNKFKLFVGNDSKFMKFIYKLNSKRAIDFINKKMNK